MSIRRLFLPCFVLAALLLAASPAFAARFDAEEGFSVELPAGWKGFSDAAVSATDIISADEKNIITIMLATFKAPDLTSMARRASPKASLGADGKSYTYATAEGERVWGMLADDGTYLQILANAPYGGMAALLGSLKCAPKNKTLTALLRAAGTKEVAGWLSFAASAPPGRPQGKVAGDAAYPDGRRSVTLPKGWRSGKGTAVTLTAPEKRASDKVAIRFKLAKGASLGDDGEKLAQAMGGKNLRWAEGSLVFTLDGGLTLAQFDEEDESAVILYLFKTGK